MPKTADRSGRAAAESGANTTAKPDASAQGLGQAEMYGTVFACGAAVMVIEILGTRIIGPVFGVSLFVWSALLAVTLASLAVGYYVGGVLVDRTPRPRLLGSVVLSAGLLLGLAPLLRRIVLRAAEGLGPRGGPLLSALFLFAPALLMLGMVGPIAVRMLTREVHLTGHRVGGIYAVSTAGSLAGTFITAFALIPTFETNSILIGTAAFLALAGAIPLAWRRHVGAIAAVLLPIFALTVPAAKLPPGLSVMARSQSLHGLLEVIEDKDRGVRLLRSDHSIIGGHFTRDHSSCFAFLHLLEALHHARPTAKRMLQIGLGIGSLPMVLQSYGVDADVVEIDPEVVRLARDYFGFSTRGDIFVEDGRTFVQRTDRRYDLVVHDTFTGGATPEHLLSLEVLERIHGILAPGGILALNFPGYADGPKAEATQAVTRTLRAVFPNVRAFRDSPADDRLDGVANIVFFATDGALDLGIPADARFENDACQNILTSFKDWEVLKQVPPGSLVTDDRNPLARLQVPIAEEHFKAMGQFLPEDLWLQ
jgi:hypothetical protein